MEIGFIGLGNMGGPMAANLLKAGHSLTVFDVSKPAPSTSVQSPSIRGPACRWWTAARSTRLPRA